MTQRPFELRCKKCFRDIGTGHRRNCSVVTDNAEPVWEDKYTNKLVKDVKAHGRYL